MNITSNIWYATCFFLLICQPYYNADIEMMSQDSWHYNVSLNTKCTPTASSDFVYKVTISLESKISKLRCNSSRDITAPINVVDIFVAKNIWKA